MSGKLKCIKFKAVESNTLKGFADIVIVSWTLRISGIGLHEKTEDGKTKRWVSLPSKDFKTGDGKRKFTPVMEFSDKAIYHRFSASCIEAIDEHLANGG